MQDLQQTNARLIFRPGADCLRFVVGADGIRFDCPMPHLAGPDHQCLAAGSSVREIENGALLDGPDNELSGVLLANEGLPLEQASENLFSRLFSLLDGRNIRRIWSFVPDINGNVNGRENYLAFTAGRHHAFTRWLGEIETGELPAASALGIHGSRLGIAFNAGPGAVEFFENPLQVPACCYPERYGKLPPLFARGSRALSSGEGVWHLSGTASIKGSDTIGSSIGEQLANTIENTRVVLERMQLPSDLPGCWKVFLRHGSDLEPARAALEKVWPSSSHEWLYLCADICRSGLLVEIEAVFDSAKRAALATL